jgi:hypothetical protein
VIVSFDLKAKDPDWRKKPRKNPLREYQSVMDQPGYKGRYRRKPKR